MAVRKLLQTYIVFLCILYSCSVVLEMKFVKGRYLSHYGAFKFNVPTMHQCAELCQALDECQSITFDKLLKQCKLNSITWPVSDLNIDVNFIYAEKTNLPIVSIFSFTLNRGASEQICFRNVNTQLGMCILTSVLLCKRAIKGNTMLLFSKDFSHFFEVGWMQKISFCI